MARRREEYQEDYEDELGLEKEAEEEQEEDYGGKAGRRKRPRSDFIDDSAIESDEEDDVDDDDERGGRKKKKKKSGPSEFFDLEAIVDSDEEDVEEDDADDFINDAGTEIAGDDGERRQRRPMNIIPEDQEDVEEMERRVYERYSRSNHVEFTEDATEVEQQVLLPSVRDPKLWMVKCAIGHERETAICLMQKCIDRPELQIRSVVALDHLKNYLYVEADKEAHVKEATKGMHNICSTAKIKLVPIKEMTDVLSVESKSVDLARDSWVRLKLGIYKGDLAKVVDVDNVRQKATVKLIPRVDLQHIAAKLEGRDVPKKKAFVPPPRFFNVEEAREMHIRVEKRRDRDSGAFFEFVDNMMFRDGFLYKTVSLKSVSTNAIQPTFDELEKFQKPGEDTDGDIASLSTLFAHRKKGHFMKGDAVIVFKGDLKNLMGWVEKVEEEAVHIKPKLNELRTTLAFNEKELCKYFKAGDHVKVVSGVQEGATGMVVKVEGHVLTILSDTTKEDIRVFADNVVESSEVTSGKTSLGGFELQDLVLMDLPRGPAQEFGGRFSGGRRHDSLVGKTVKIRLGPWKGYRGRVKGVTGVSVRVELDSQMKVVTVKKTEITDGSAAASPLRESTRYGTGSEAPMHPSRTPMHYQTPMRDPGGDGDGNWLVTDIYVNVSRTGEEPLLGNNWKEYDLPRVTV